ncbi:hypothetical protein [Streptomyces sp. S.PB5]|uniref:hypothetical protein n=1 Tax=Streptomyces sp. S.PB5 TaxID=3020844 RepID=UPI0025B0ADBE|nr:hypothetical protein [Streptomyces sp. S.PB5]MDN3026651.1 hypothetical protein [Streptomyces sp. S.PB5]
MTTAQTEGLIGMLVVLGILVVLIAPSVVGILRDRRIDREINRLTSAVPAGEDHETQTVGRGRQGGSAHPAYGHWRPRRG